MQATTFSELSLPQSLQQGIDDLGYSELTAVQQLALPLTLAGKDVAGQGRTGTGKTATFLITIFQRLLTHKPKNGRTPQHPRAVVIAPTRELVIQIGQDALTLGKHTDLKVHTVYGGVDYEKQRKAFDDGVDILIGTPGRLIDYFKKHCYKLDRTEIMVLDEADRMFDLGFIKDIRFMLHRLPKYNERQALLFSATLSCRVMELAYEHMNNPEKLEAETGDITASGITESLYHTAMDDKFPLLVHLLRQDEVTRGMIFINQKRDGERVAKQLARYGFKIGILSGDVRQAKRMRILQDFTDGTLQLLVATDVASRGIHVDAISHVFNYDLPEDAENYVHRIGRTARAGEQGVAISFACERFCFGLPDIESYIKRSIPVASIPEPLDIGAPTHPDGIAEGAGSQHRVTTNNKPHSSKQHAGNKHPQRRKPAKTRKA